MPLDSKAIDKLFYGIMTPIMVVFSVFIVILCSPLIIWVTFFRDKVFKPETADDDYGVVVPAMKPHLAEVVDK